jgi:phosphoribosylaminoimidazole-succinocarboxamide synthase
MHKDVISGLPLFSRGKVREMYDLGDHLLMVASDRISCFDVVLPTEIPDKGKVLTSLSAYWFKAMEDIAPHHMVTTNVDEFPAICHRYRDRLEGRSMLVKRAKPAPVECIVRGYLFGSAWNEYQKTGSVSGIPLPVGLREASRLEEPIFTPSTKAPVGEHDENITFEQMVERIGRKTADHIRDVCIAIYLRARKMAESKGIIICDTKLELGLENDRVIVIDELLTPDSSRFWPLATYQVGSSPESFDKQYVRDYLLNIHWDTNTPPPVLPPVVVQKTREKYTEALRRLTADAKTPN